MVHEVNLKAVKLKAVMFLIKLNVHDLTSAALVLEVAKSTLAQRILISIMTEKCLPVFLGKHFAFIASLILLRL